MSRSRVRVTQLSAAALLFAATAWAADYHVGPGQSYTMIGQVPWYALQAGDTVYIHYQSTPYREKFLISGQGTPAAWIRVIGVPGPNGELPVISGNGATTSKNNHYRWQDATGGSAIQWDGVIQIAVQADNPNGTSASLPAYIEVSGLQVQDARPSYSFTAENGTVAKYDSFAACIYSRSAKHILIDNNVMTNCGLGFYNWTGDGTSGGNTWWDGVQVDTTLRGNYFYNNGTPGSYTEHQTYTESLGVTLEYNKFGPQTSGSLGSQLKDRSAGTVIRYNYIQQSPAGWDMDLVEPQNGWPALGPSPTYSQAFVYGNTIVNTGVYDPNYIHWNEDQMDGQGRAEMAAGRLFFYDNTIVTVANQSDMSSFTLFNVTWGAYECHPPDPGIIDVRNNIFAVLPRTPGAAIPQQTFGYCGAENFNFGVNWVSPGWTVHGASAAGTANLISPSDNNPGFVNGALDVHLAPGSSAIGKAGAPAPEVTSNYLGGNFTPTLQYVDPAKAQNRTSIADLGAYQAGTVSGCAYTVTPATATFPAAASTGSESVTTASGCAWNASSGSPWLKITYGTSGSGPGQVDFTVDANTSSSRTGSLSIAGVTVPVVQAGPSCSYALSPTAASVAASGGTGSIQVTSGSGCSWTAASNATPWLAVTSGATGSGNGTVGYSVAANTASTSRTGTLTIGGQAFTVTQAGAATCSYSISPANTTVGSTGGTGDVSVTAGAGCPWTAASNASSWLKVTSGASGSGNGKVGYSASANSNKTGRKGTITIGGQVFSVSEAGGGASCSFGISPASVSLPAGGGSGSVAVTSGGCAWSSSSNASWITVQGSGSGGGSATYTVAANTGAAGRTGTATIAGLTFTVSQAGTSGACNNCVTYRQGDNGYKGEVEKNISSLYANESWNGGIGVTDAGGSQYLELKNDSEYEARALLRFTGISIPSGKKVASASLALTLVNWVAPAPAITGYYVLEPWDGTSASTVNWKYYSPASMWNLSGAYGIGTDVSMTKPVVISGITDAGKQVVQAVLDPATVQSWIDNPAMNQGVLLTIPLQPANGWMNVYSSGASQNLRPLLTINYR